MNFTRVIYDVVQVDRYAGLICAQDAKGEKIEIRVTIGDNKALITEIKEGDKLEVEVNGWQIKSIKKVNSDITNSINNKTS